MTRVLAGAADAGRSCPYCRFPLKEGAPAERCDACGCLHHEDCWMDGNGCAVLGCSGAGTGAATVVARPSAAQPPSPYPAAPGAQPGPPTIAPVRKDGLQWLIVASLIAVAGIAVGALIATRALSGGKPAPLAAGASHAAAQLDPGAQQASSRRAIVTVLRSYERAYSTHDLGGLSAVFSSQVKRHGLAAGGCNVVQGRSAVLGDYASQFAQGTGEYALVGLAASQIAFAGAARAHVNANYRISTGGAGFVDFDFAEEGGSWKITQVYATCA